MKSIQEIHAATTLLDHFGANKTQFVFLSREDYEKTWGSILIGAVAQGLVYKKLKETSVSIIASICIDAFDFIFIDPSELFALTDLTAYLKSLRP